jgi:signal transduction histidine kinase
MLRRYLSEQQEKLLQQAYELGRGAIARGLGVLDVARLHQRALASCLPPVLPGKIKSRTLKAAETFFMETLSPFEAAHRGFRKANLELRQVNQSLEQRNAELDRINRALAREVRQRKRTEKALRQSEDHYRQLFRHARLMQENLRSLSQRILHAQEEERKRISRELHDEVGQALTAASTGLEMLQRNGVADARQLKKKIVDTQNFLAQTMDLVHRFARELRPAMLDELGLLPALRSYLRGFAERTGLRVRFAATVQAEKLNNEQKIVLYRVTQESLTNVARHAQASQVAVTLRKLKDLVQMRIRDDGRAFRVNGQPIAHGKERLGLLGMQERVRLVNGRFAVRPVPGKGTTVTVEIPFETGGTLAPGKAMTSRLKAPKGLLRRRKAILDTLIPERGAYAKDNRSIS